jgi:ribonuclease R
MEFSIASLLSNFTDDKLVAPKALEKKLGCQDEESLAKLQIALDALEKIGVLVKERGKYRRVYEDDVVEAKLRCSSKGFCFAIQDVEGADDIYIQKSHLSTAWNGDRVLVKITKEGSRRRSPEGQVKLILERANPSVLARVRRTNGSFQAVPLDDRLLFELDLKPERENLDQAVETTRSARWHASWAVTLKTRLILTSSAASTIYAVTFPTMFLQRSIAYRNNSVRQT